MSNLRSPRTLLILAAAASGVLPCLCVFVIAGARPARADDAPSPFEALADFVTAPPEYRGPTLPFPDAVARPALSGLDACAELTPVCVHAPPQVTDAQVKRALAAADAAYLWLEADGWPLPGGDAGRGGGAQLDVYLVGSATEAARAVADAPLDYGALDAASTHAELDPALPDAELEPCAAYAIAQAGLLAQDSGRARERAPCARGFRHLALQRRARL